MGGAPAHVTYGATPKRETLFWFRPGDLVVVGLDVPDDPESPVSDKDRVDLGWDEAMVRSIMAHGVREPVIFRKRAEEDPPRSEVVAGRGREMAAREAVRRLREAGTPEEDLPLVPGIKVDKKATDKDILAIVIEENAIRRQETVLSLARKARRYLAVCLAEARAANLKESPDADPEPTKAQVKAARAETAAVCGCNPKTLGDWLLILDLAPGVLRLVDAGKVAPYVALELMKGVPLEEQEAKMQEHVAAGRTKGLAAQAEAVRSQEPQFTPGHELASTGGVAGQEAEPEERPALPGRRKVLKFREGLTKVVPADVTFTRAHLANLLDFVFSGKPLRGPLREAWEKAAALKPEKKAARA